MNQTRSLENANDKKIKYFSQRRKRAKSEESINY